MIEVYEEREWSDVLAGKNKMSEKNQAVAASASVANVVDWDKVDLQAIILASNQGRLGKPLTDWLASQSWNQGKFLVRDHFKVDVSRAAKVKISGIGSNFQNWFINAVEEFPPAAALVQTVLTENSLDSAIIAKLGGVAKVISTLGEMFALMENQPKGPKSKAGPLLVNGYANIAYVPQPVKKLDGNRFSYVNFAGEEIFDEVKDSQYLFEVNGQALVLRAVNVGWLGDGWVVSAFSVEDPRGWGAVSRVFSRKALKLSGPQVPAPAV